MRLLFSGLSVAVLSTLVQPLPAVVTFDAPGHVYTDKETPVARGVVSAQSLRFMTGVAARQDMAALLMQMAKPRCRRCPLDITILRAVIMMFRLLW
jgi:hypothetical protein